MRAAMHVEQHFVYQSEVREEVATHNSALAGVLQWADDNPHVWNIVTKRRSKAFGLGSCEYIGWAQGSMEGDAVIERLRHFKQLVLVQSPFMSADSIFVWRAQFTFHHYKEKGFTGGFFQQHDPKYPRSCLTLDYTPATKEEVLTRFCRWMDGYYDTSHITLDGEVVRKLK